MDRDGRKEALDRAERYEAFITRARTVRTTVMTASDLAVASGFHPIDLDSTGPIEAGQKVIAQHRGKVFVAARVGQADSPFRVIVVPIDAPRIDLKPRPVQTDTDTDVVLFDTHFYGHINRKAWLNVPLALFGDFLDGGKLRSVTIGMKPQEPVLVIPDLLPHLAGKSQKNEVIDGESLDAIAGFDHELVLESLRDGSGISEASFVVGEFSLVPAVPPARVGIDQGLIAAYGQQFRSVLFAGLEAMADDGDQRMTAVLIGIDKAEIGSTGNTGTSAVRFVLGQLHERTCSQRERTELGLRRRLHRSRGWVATRVGGEPGAGVVLNGRRDDALPGAQRKTLDALEGARVSYQLAYESNWGSPARRLGTQNVPFLDFAIPVAGHGSPIEVVHLADLHWVVQATRSWLSIPP